jgi:hypothetical protein
MRDSRRPGSVNEGLNITAAKPLAYLPSDSTASQPLSVTVAYPRLPFAKDLIIKERHSY